MTTPGNPNDGAPPHDDQSDPNPGSDSRPGNAAAGKIEDADRMAREALDVSRTIASTLGGAIRESIKSVRSNRDAVVMARVSGDTLEKLDQLVYCGLTNSRSEAAALLISEGIKARADLYEKIAEQSEIIRKAREELDRLLDENPAPETDSPGA